MATATTEQLAEIEKQGELIRSLKTASTPDVEALAAAVEKLKALKAAAGIVEMSKSEKKKAAKLAKQQEQAAAELAKKATADEGKVSANGAKKEAAKAAKAAKKAAYKAAKTSGASESKEAPVAAVVSGLELKVVRLDSEVLKVLAVAAWVKKDVTISMVSAGAYSRCCWCSNCSMRFQ
jgi:hypothetical protein